MADATESPILNNEVTTVDFVASPSGQVIPAYVNNAQVSFSAWDVTMLFGQVLALNAGKLTVEQRASIVMSPQHTKAFWSVLGEHIKKYEEAFGEIEWRQKTAQHQDVQ